MKITLLVMMLLGGLWGGYASAQDRVFTWTDQDGTVHFSDKPTGAQATPIAVKPTKPDRPAAGMPPQDSAADAAAAPAADQNPVQIANPDEDPALRKKNCAQSQRVVKSLEEAEGRRLYTENEKGERHWFTDAERAAKLDEARKAVTKWCS